MGIKESIKNVSFIHKAYLSTIRRWRRYKKRRLIISNITRAKKSDPQIVFLLLTPVHGNMGDHAIALAEQRMLNELNMSYYEVSGKDLFLLESANRLSVFNKYPIFINGGGYLGTLWYHDERLVRNIIVSNPDSEILLFPNTVVYEDTLFGKKEFVKAKTIYKQHSHLKLYAREKKSVAIMRELCDSVDLAPDMAMSLREDCVSFERSGCSLFLRKDKERTLTDGDFNDVVNGVKELFDENYKECDTVLDYDVSFENRKKELNKLFGIYRSSELVITDRLHGMLFGAITGTPTIVLNSKSHKVIGCYEWLKHLDYIKICESPNKISEIYKDMPHGSQCYDNTAITDAFLRLRKDLLSFKL